MSSFFSAVLNRLKSPLAREARPEAATIPGKFQEYQAKAEQGEAEAQFKLGFCYDGGRGVAKDYVKAAKWYRKAAEQNYAPAQSNLGCCYDSGLGVAMDYA